MGKFLSILTSIVIFVWVINKIKLYTSSFLFLSALLRKRVSQTYLLRHDRDWIIIALNEGKSDRANYLIKIKK